MSMEEGREKEVKKTTHNVKVKLRFFDLSVKVRPIEWHCKIKRKEGNLQ